MRNPHEGITSRNFKEIANKKDNKRGTRLEQTEFIRGAIRRGSRRGGPLWMVVIGEKLGLYKALAEGPLNSSEQDGDLQRGQPEPVQERLALGFRALVAHNLAARDG